MGGSKIKELPQTTTLTDNDALIVEQSETKWTNLGTIKKNIGDSVKSDMKNGSVQTGLNAEKVNNKTVSATPSTSEKNDLVGMVNELNTNKVNKTESTLTTTSKVVVTAINELNTNKVNNSTYNTFIGTKGQPNGFAPLNANGTIDVGYQHAIGDIITATSSPSASWLPCDGRAISISTYGSLYNKIGETFTEPTVYNAVERNVTIMGSRYITNLVYNSGVFLAIADDGRLYKSVDDCVSWTLVTSAPITTNRIACVNGYFVTYNQYTTPSNIYYSDKNLTSWSTKLVETYPNTSYSSIFDIVYFKNMYYIAYRYANSSSGSYYHGVAKCTTINGTWSNAWNDSTSDTPIGLTYKNDIMFYYPHDSNYAVYTKDGLNWTTISKSNTSGGTVFKNSFININPNPNDSGGGVYQSLDGFYNKQLTEWENSTRTFLNLGTNYSSNLNLSINSDKILFAYIREWLSPRTDAIGYSYDLINWNLITTPQMGNTDSKTTRLLYVPEINKLIYYGGLSYVNAKLYTFDCSTTADSTFKIPTIANAYIKAT